MTITVRAASKRDQDAITTLVYSERMNPFDLDWRRFLVATDAAGVAGIAQIRSHFDDASELGSLVVRPDMRGRGIAARLIDALMLFAQGRGVYMVAGARFASHYAHWGFAPVAPGSAPVGVLRSYVLGRLAGVVARVTGRAANPLVVLAKAHRRADPRLVTPPVRVLQRRSEVAAAPRDNRIAA